MKALLEDSKIFAIPDVDVPDAIDVLDRAEIPYTVYSHPHACMNDWYAQCYLMGGSTLDNRESAAKVTLANYEDFRDRKIKHLTEARDSVVSDFENAAQEYVNEHYSEDEKRLSGWN